MSGSATDFAASLSPTDVDSFVATLSDDEVAVLAYDWSFWGRPEQQAPDGDWRGWLILTGRGWGKTRTGAEWAIDPTGEGTGPEPEDRIALVGATAADVRDVMVEGESGILAIAPPWNRPTYESSKRRLTWKNGAMATTYSADEPDRLRGPQHSRAWCVAGGTEIETEDGPVPIESVEVGMRVWTRRGLCAVKRSGLTMRGATTMVIRTTDGHALHLTPNHSVYVRGRGWVPCGSVAPSDILTAWRYATDRLRGSSGKGSAGIDGGPDTTPTAPDRFSMLRYGNVSTGDALTPAGAYITETATPATTTPRISKRWNGASTPRSTWPSAVASIRGASRRTVSQPAGVQESFGMSGNPDPWSVSDAEWNTNPSECGPSSAPLPVLHDTVVASVEPSGRSDVYDLTIETAPEFFAGGILVHNCDEIASWRYGPETWANLMFGLRIGPARWVATTTPRPVRLVRDLMALDGVAITRGTIYDNRPNLAEPFFNEIISKYEGTRIGRQELEGELLDDVPGALWNRALIEASRLHGSIPELVRTIVAIDPAVTSGEEADLTGIIVAGKGVDGVAYILEDASCRVSPDSWARKAIDQYYRHSADRVVAETNNGGEMVALTLRTVDPAVSYKAVHASKGKRTRAEPVAALYEQGKVKHVRPFPELEDEQCAFVPDLHDTPDDRVDALVWALTELMLEGPRSRIGVI